MDDSSYKSLLHQNTDFVNSEGGTSVSEVPAVNLENGSGSPPTPPKTETSEGPKYPDREILIGSLGERIDGFFGMARVRTGRIAGSTDEIRRSGIILEDVAGRGKQIGRIIDEVRDPKAEEISSIITPAARRADESAVEIQRSVGALKVDEQIGFIKGQEAEFAGGRLDQYQQELRDALKIEDPEVRSAKLEELKAKVINAVLRIDQDAQDGSNKAFSLKDRVENGTASIPRAADEAHYLLPRLHEKMGDSYYRVINMMQDMAGSYSSFKRGAEHLDSLPLEFRLLSNAANELGVSITEIFDAFAKGKFT